MLKAHILSNESNQETIALIQLHESSNPSDGDSDTNATHGQQLAVQVHMSAALCTGVLAIAY